MLRDVFYYGKKPNIHPREQYAENLIDARKKASTDHFWIINEFCDYTGFDWDFDFDFLPDEDVWAEYHNNVWPSIHQKDSGTWLCSKKYSDTIVYRKDVVVLNRKNEINDNWKLTYNVDIKNFDFSWHPDPTDPPYIYKWGCKYFPVETKSCIEYQIPGAIEIKYMKEMVELLPEWDHWNILPNIDKNKFDFAWMPNPTSPPYIYAWGNQWNKPEDKISIQFVVPGATEYKYMEERAMREPCMDNWIIPENINVSNFDFSWEPNPKDPAYIYEFGTQWQKTGGPKYVGPGATEIKYISIQHAIALPDKEKWEIPKNLDITDFDFSWHPDSTSPPYIYHFATQWALTGGPIYRCPNATEIKYLEEPSAVALPDKTNWVIPSDIDAEAFDFSWHPYIDDQPYIYQFGTQWQKTGGPKYITPGVIPNSPVKYIDRRILKAKRLSNKSNFSILNNYKIKNFDFSWHPDSTEDPYIYIFGNNQYPAEIMPTIEYAMQGAKEIKYVYDVVAILDTDMLNWEVPNNIDVSEFDFSWKPNPKDPPFIYQFGTQWQKTGGPKYIVPGAEQVKYVEGSKAKAISNKDNWIIPEGLSIEYFDYSWHPDITEEVYIYSFATQWHDRGGPIYMTPGSNKSTSIKYVDSKILKAILGKNMNNWVIPNDVEIKNFDFSWVPHPDDPAYIYQFGTQWQKTGGPKYTVTGATEIKYIDSMKVKRLPSKNYWFNPYKVDTTRFDFSWHPDDTAPPYVYQFGTEQDKTDGPRYLTPGANDITYLLRVEVSEELYNSTIQPEIKPKEKIINTYFIETTLDDLVNKHPDEIFWALNKHIDYSGFDFTWRPMTTQVDGENIDYESNYVHTFGSPDSIFTHTYFVHAKEYLLGNKDLKYVEDIRLDENYLSKLFIKPDMFFVDRGNKDAQNRFEKLKEKYGSVQKTRFLNSWVDTINRCINRSSTDLCWILNSELDYTDFNFNYYPNPWQMKMVHVFGTQWNHWGTTFMVNRETFANDTKYIKIIEHLNNLNFVKDRTALATDITYDIVYIDHNNLNQDELQIISDSGKLIVKYDTDYLTTFKSMLKFLPEKKEHYIWVASTICDYKNFDFTYICDPFAKDQLHVFPSDKQKFGDTFFINVNKLRELINNIQTLNEYDKINYNQALKTTRLPSPIIVTEFDSHVMSVMQDFNFPYATFVTEDNKDIKLVDDEPMSLWDKKSKNILITSTGGTRIIVPKEAKQYVDTQLYDYPYIKTMSKLAKSKPMDIVFLSNGEKCADENYEHLLKITKGLPNRIVRVDGVNGRVEAYHAAAESSNTPWLFTVFAKLKVNPKFDFNWQPDRLQIPKHYMFLARNPVNGLIYGHQGMIAYNKQLVLSNMGNRLDFTLDSPHETVEILSGIAMYNTDEFSTWRTAFREVIKLKNDNSEISQKRLDAWLNKAEGDFAEHSLLGAKDGVAYYKKSKGKLELLRLSYEWKWLNDFYSKKYKKK